MKIMASLLAAAVCLLAVSNAAAEKYEKQIFLEPSLFLPSLHSNAPESFALSTWGLSGAFYYGVFNRIDIFGRFFVSNFSAHTNTDDDNLNLKFSSTVFSPEAGLRFKLWPGYSIAPYIEGGMGFQWAQYTNVSKISQSGINAGSVDAFGEGHAVATVGGYVDWRFSDLFFIGVGLRYRYVIGSPILQSGFVVPICLGVKFDI